MATGTGEATRVAVRALEESDLPLADRICRTAFGTFLGAPEPERFFGDADFVFTRFRSEAVVGLAAEIDGELVGTNFVTNWGSVGYFGPLTVRTDLWDAGIASRLMDATVEVFRQWGTKHPVLFTFAHSPKHHGLYQKFGFYPTFLTAILSKAVDASVVSGWTKYSDTAAPDMPALVDQARALTNSVYEGLDLSGEIRAVAAQALGDTILVWDDTRLAGLAICHVGAGTEAGSGACFVKFGAAANGESRDFERLVDACEAYAAQRGAERVIAGANMGRIDAYRMLCARGYRSELTGVAMQQDGDFGYNRPQSFVIDDWR